MNQFTDVFIHRPVLAIVVSLLIVVFGVRSFSELSLRQYPEISYPAVSVTTTYPGASADLVQGFITEPLQSSMGGAEGIDYMESTSSDGVSHIVANLYADHDVDAALIDINARVNKLRKSLPLQADEPIVEKYTERGRDAMMYVGFFSEDLSQSEITEYLQQAVMPVINTLPGIGNVEMSGGRPFAMRVWLNTERMAAFGISAGDVQNAISANNFQGVAGEIRNEHQSVNVSPQTGLNDVRGFEQLVIRHDGNQLVRLADIARVEMGSAQEDEFVIDQGRLAVFIGVSSADEANPLEVADAIYTVIPDLQSQAPGNISIEISFDVTKAIRHSIREVNFTILEASVIVIGVVFLFLGSVRAVSIPVVTIPLSLIGVVMLMLSLGFSLNLLTLLAMVLAIGLVVDDAIVVVENIQRHIEEGDPPLQASLKGAREIAFPVIAMTLTLAAVYAPLGMVTGLTGVLFQEFAFTLAGAVLISGVVALTLSPMMCSRLLNSAALDNSLVRFLDRSFDKLQERYRSILAVTLQDKPLILAFCAVVFCALIALFFAIPQELGPTEDNSELFVSGEGVLSSTLEFTEKYIPQIEQIQLNLPEYQSSFLNAGVFGGGSLVSVLMLKPWDERERSSMEVQQELMAEFNNVAGMRLSVFHYPDLPGASADLPVKFVVASTGSHRLVHQVAEELVAKAQASGRFVYVDSELKFNNPQYVLNIDRDRAAELGISMAAISEALVTFLGENESSDFNLNNRSYDVILQVEKNQRHLSKSLDDYYVRSEGGVSVPLSALVRRELQVRPNALKQYQQLNSATIGALMAPGVTIGEAIELFEEYAQDVLPSDFSHDFLGQSRQFIEEGDKLLWTFMFSFLVIYLVLAAQFESFSDPLVVLISVPLSVCGALIPMALGFATMNIFTQVGLLTLIGLISKHGILIVDFANKLRAQRNLSAMAAVQEAAVVRLRPILMTTAAMVFGVIPLLLATGAGAEARSSIGLVIYFGMSIGTLFTLFVLPTIYVMLSSNKGKTR